MKRLFLVLAMLGGAFSPAMSQDLFSTLFGVQQAPQAQEAPPGYGYYGRRVRRLGRAIFGPMSGMVEETANRYGVPPALVHAVAMKESGERCLRGRGIMQINARTAASMGVRSGSCPANVAAGVLYLKQAIAMHGWGCAAFSAYQSGLGVHRCSSYGRSIMAMMHGGSGTTQSVAYFRGGHHRTHYASRNHKRYAAHHHHHYSRYASR